MRIAATGEFGAVTWEMSPEMSEQYRSDIARIKEVLGEQAADDFERTFVEQVQGIFTVTAFQLKGTICAPHLALIMLPMLINGLKMTSQAALDLLDAERRNSGQ